VKREKKGITLLRVLGLGTRLNMNELKKHVVEVE